MSIKFARVEKLFKSPGSHPNGLQAAPDGLWCIDQANHKVHRLDYQTGETLFEAQTDTVHSSGITVGDGYLWIASTYENKIAQLDLATGATIAKYDSPGSGVISFNEDQENPQFTGAHGLEWRGGKLYVASPPSQMIHVIDPKNWQEEYAFRTPGLRVHGLAWATNGRLWAADTSAGTICLLDPTSGRVYDVARVEAPTEVHGMTIHEGVLWYCHDTTCDIGCLFLE
ncbi:TPA: hypothetical protein EYN65_23010 [Candidatus Poribacteria bacterium]|jgi:streptogramin lyase|nr:hypothetical protein [Candidatus Poribacteria bacterium]HIC00121.1 hypothetical protein [Candidatus Poribacteria bacterium]HIN32297.1 hypothetical protein [Candidatus Poribacteria bacterium]